MRSSKSSTPISLSTSRPRPALPGLVSHDRRFALAAECRSAERPCDRGGVPREPFARKQERDRATSPTRLPATPRTRPRRAPRSRRSVPGCPGCRRPSRAPARRRSPSPRRPPATWDPDRGRPLQRPTPRPPERGERGERRRDREDDVHHPPAHDAANLRWRRRVARQELVASEQEPARRRLRQEDQAPRRASETPWTPASTS